MDAPRKEYLDAYFTAEPGLAERFGVVTACNPNGKTRPAQENAQADEELRAALTAAGFKIWRVTGRSKDGAHQEPGWGIAAGSPEDLRPWSRKFRQVAFFWVDGGCVFVLNTEGKARHFAALWAERLIV